MPDALTLIEKHRGKGVFVDTNLLVLLLVGSVNERRIREFKRTRDSTTEDFHILRRLVQWFGEPLVTTPHVLSQVSDLSRLSGWEGATMHRLFKSVLDAVDEKYDAAKNLAGKFSV